eukprot:315779-Karenia_brevis.AAC.1
MHLWGQRREEPEAPALLLLQSRRSTRCLQQCQKACQCGEGVSSAHRGSERRGAGVDAARVSSTV